MDMQKRLVLPFTITIIIIIIIIIIIPRDKEELATEAIAVLLNFLYEQQKSKPWSPKDKEDFEFVETEEFQYCPHCY